jgi:lysophospholipase L1-like esterase
VKSLLPYKLLALLVLAAGVVWLVVTLRSSKESTITNFPPKGTTIVALGDSLTYGIGASSRKTTYVGLLEEELNIAIDNKGVGGDTTHDALVRLDRDVLAVHPDIVIVLLGSNDYLKGVPQEETFRNLQTIISRIQAKGAVVLLVGARGGALRDKFADSFAVLAESTRSAFVPGALDGVIGDAKLLSDEIHPNDAGYRLMAEKISPVLKGLIDAVPQAGEDR